MLSSSAAAQGIVTLEWATSQEEGARVQEKSLLRLLWGSESHSGSRLTLNLVGRCLGMCAQQIPSMAPDQQLECLLVLPGGRLREGSRLPCRSPPGAG